jgi:fructokinase
LGAQARVITRVGNDALGRGIIRRLGDMGLPVNGVQVDESAPTGTVTVALSGNGVPEYTIHEQVAWDRIAATSETLELVRDADAICFGSLAQRSPVSRVSIQRLLSAAPAKAWRILDINLRQPFYNREIIEHSLNLSNVLKLNEIELPILARMFAGEGTIRQQMELLAQRFKLQVVALTRGPAGSLLYRDGAWSEHAACFAEVKDTVGAGDSFTAALCLGLLDGLELDKINDAASKVAAYVCGCSGATPKLPTELFPKQPLLT